MHVGTAAQSVGGGGGVFFFVFFYLGCAHWKSSLWIASASVCFFLCVCVCWYVLHVYIMYLCCVPMSSGDEYYPFDDDGCFCSSVRSLSVYLSVSFAVGFPYAPKRLKRQGVSCGAVERGRIRGLTYPSSAGHQHCSSSDVWKRMKWISFSCDLQRLFVS